MSMTIESLEIINIENEGNGSILKQVALDVTFPLQEEDKVLILKMKNKLLNLGGVGLAAPQVKERKRIIAIYIPEEAALLRDNVLPYDMHIMINPRYEGIERNGFWEDFEGCYSVASKMGKVPRYKTINIYYQDELGNKHESTESGFYARVLQHEVDHLDGFLITDRLTPNSIQGSMEEMMALRRESLSEDKRALFDEIVKKKMDEKKKT